MKRAVLWVGLTAAAGVLAVPAVSVLYESSSGQGCARCHEMLAPFRDWRASTHRAVKCGACHGDALTLDAGFHWRNVMRVVAHLRGQLPEQVRLHNGDIGAMVERCQGCHRQEFAQWKSGLHSATYSRIFLDRKQNSTRRLMDDCMRCHGMFFEGGIADLVTPVSLQGPWRLKEAALANQAVMPCLACHSMHREGAPMRKPEAGPRQAVVRPSLALFDRREGEYHPAAEMALPAMLDGARPVKISPDPRQSLCYQCHAPRPERQVNSGDDRTPVGVHEGLSCLACHEKHGQQTRASCATCHPRLSNCGRDVEKMDTTFLATTSRHNIHFVKCADCHPKGVPPKRNVERAALGGE